MVVVLLITTFLIAFGVASIVSFIFAKPIDLILKQVVPDELNQAWARYLKFAIYVVGIGGGVRVWSLEKYLTVQEPYLEIVPLTPARWLFEIYETVIGTLQSTAILLLVFFVFGLIAVVIVRIFEPKTLKTDAQKKLEPEALGTKESNNGSIQYKDW
jgi:hypothetical protein